MNLNKIFPFLLLGTLSMLFAEIFSGASQVWFVNPFALLVTFPLYLAHVLFFLWIAFKTKKVSLTQLYFFGVLFGLYESWITKVLWSGYPNEAGSTQFGTLLGVGIGEFPILVFFYHSIMSFIVPVLVYQLLNGKVLMEHNFILKKTKLKSYILVFLFMLFSSFTAFGNAHNIVSANISYLGTLLLIYIFYYLSKKEDLSFFYMKKSSFIIWTVYLILLYIITFFALLPERLSQEILPYVTIIIFYIIIIFLIIKTKSVPVNLVPVSDDSYTKKDLVKAFVIFWVFLNIFCLFAGVSTIVFFLTYILFIFVGIFLFFNKLYLVLFKS